MLWIQNLFTSKPDNRSANTHDASRLRCSLQAPVCKSQDGEQSPEAVEPQAQQLLPEAEQQLPAPAEQPQVPFAQLPVAEQLSAVAVQQRESAAQQPVAG
jgi:hypothetical protein